MAVPCRSVSGPLRLGLGVRDWLSGIRSLTNGDASLARLRRPCLVPGCGRHPERAGVGSPQQGAVGLVEAGQAAGRGRWRPAARYISGAADLTANGGKLPDGIPETARN